MISYSKNLVSNDDFSIDNLDCMIDLHLHLDGAISLESTKELAKMQGIEIPKTDDELLKLIRVSKDCKNLNEFLEKFKFPCSLLQTKESIKMAFSNLLKELKEHGVMYAEIRFAPQLLLEKGLTIDEVVASAILGMKEVDIDSNLILCCMRGKDNHKLNIETVNVAKKYLNNGVVAIDLAGAEALYKTSNFDDIFALARSYQVPYTIHAGEADGIDSIKKAIEFGAKRIGHGVHIIDDDTFFKEFAKKNIPLELCPTSNIQTAIFENISDWPLKKFMNANIYITINTDDPSIEGTSIKNEYKKLIDNFGIGKKEVQTFLMNAVNASFASDDIKQKMFNKIKENFKEEK